MEADNLLLRIIDQYCCYDDGSIGCLCGLHPQWLPLNKWAHGFAEITGLPDGLWRVKNYRILDGVII